jgi:type II secretory pathway component GspD/PulD (secretin)
MVEQIDRPVSGITELRVFRLRNADPAELAEQLGEVFPDENKSNSNQSNTGIRFAGGPPGMGGFGGGPGGGAFGGPPGSGGGVSQTGASDRVRKSTKVLAVPDSRTSSLLVSAASALMPQIASMVESLDANPARKEVVSVYDLHNINPNELNQVLQDLFNRNGAVRNTSSSRNSLLGSNDPLVARQTQQQIPLNIGNSGSGGSMGTGGVGGAGTSTGF